MIDFPPGSPEAGEADEASRSPLLALVVQNLNNLSTTQSKQGDLFQALSTRLDSLQSKVEDQAEMEARLQAIESRLNEIDHSPPKATAGSRLQGEANRLQGEAINEDLNQLRKSVHGLLHASPSKGRLSRKYDGKDPEDVPWSSEYAVQESTWEAIVFVGLSNVVDLWDSILLTLSFSINLLLQGFACYMLQQPAFTGKPLTDRVLDNLKRWRLSIAHSWSYADPAMQPSLASRVCNKDPGLTLATDQKQMYQSLETYNDSFGHMLAIVALSILVCCCVAEVRACLTFTSAFLHTPRFPKAALVIEGTEMSLISINRRRVMLCISVFVVRVTIVAFILLSGCRWLTYTQDIEALLLNASALGFVLELDELIYAAFVPLRWEEVLRITKPLPLSERHRVARWAPSFLVVFSFVLIVTLDRSLLEPYMVIMGEVRDTLCRGEKDFVYGINSLSQVQWTTSPGYEDASDVSRVRQEIVDALIDSNTQYANQVASMLPPLGFTEVLKLSLIRIAEETLGCKDYEGELLGKILWSVSGQLHFYNESLTGCTAIVESFPGICEELDYSGLGNAVRYHCPSACGCDDASSGMFALNAENYGCTASQCWRMAQAKLVEEVTERLEISEEEAHAARSALSEGNGKGFEIFCRDTEAKDLAEKPAWQRLVRVFGQVAAFEFPLLTPAMISEASSLLMSHGCEVVEHMAIYNKTMFDVLCLRFVSGASYYCPIACKCTGGGAVSVLNTFVPADYRCPSFCTVAGVMSQASSLASMAR